MRAIDDIKKVYNSPSAVAERERREREYEEKHFEENRIRREKAEEEVNKVLLLCNDAAQHGYKSCSIKWRVSDAAWGDLRKKGISIDYDVYETTFSGW